MSDRFGLLQLPASAPTGDPVTTAVGDPLLDVLAAFLKAAINADTKALWAKVHPIILPPAGEPVPVLKTFTHNPDDGSFSTKTLPALFVWRHGAPRNVQLTQEWDVSDTVISVLWVPPLATVEKSRIRQPFRNAVTKAIGRAIARERHPAWIADGDTDPVAEYRGSFLIQQLNVMRLSLVDVKPYDLTVDRADKQEPYDAVLGVLEVRELLVPVLDDYDPIEEIRGTVSLGADADALPVNSFRFRPTLLSVEGPSGVADGGSDVTLRGYQFPVGLDEGITPTVLFGEEPATDVVVVSENEIRLRTPPHAQGTVDVTLILPSGAQATLADAYTFTSQEGLLTEDGFRLLTEDGFWLTTEG